MIVRVDVVPIVLEMRRVIVAEVIGGYHGQAQLGRWWLPSGVLGEGEQPGEAELLALIREAVARDVPVLGHCLGGQLMAKALGAAVTQAPVKEIGWGQVKTEDAAESEAWFGHDRTQFLCFHWHGEMFSIPEAATRVLSSSWCANQAFVLGKHLAMQCHVEMTEELVRSWCKGGADEIARSRSPAVQSVAAILTDLKSRLDALHRIADRVYTRWLEGLRG